MPASYGKAVRQFLETRLEPYLLTKPDGSTSGLVTGYYEPLLRAGVQIHERHGVILHAKTALIDGVWATVGSTNLDWRSFLHNHELNAVVLGSEFGLQVQAMFERDLALSTRITLDAWERRPLHWRMQELFARTWAYWL